MADLHFRARRFSSSFGHVNGLHTPQVSRKKCIKFAQVVGNSHYSAAFGQSATALALASYRAMAVRCVLDFSQSRVRRSPEYVSLEASEKVNLSYWIGMTFAAIAADSLLGVPRLTHAARYGGSVVLSRKTKSLADLVGQDAAANWHVIEAKGRQSPPSSTSRRKWKRQARTIHSINGKIVSTRSYCVGIIDDPCESLIVDPSGREREQFNLVIPPDDIGDGYYESFRAFLKSNARVVKRHGRSFTVRVAAFDPIDKDYIYVGVEDHLLKKRRPSKHGFALLKEVDEDDLYVGTDGVAIVSASGPCDL